MAGPDDLERRLRCARCAGRIARDGSTWTAEGIPDDYPALVCADCGARYPVSDGVPIIFDDDERARVILDPRARADRVGDVTRKMERAVGLAGDALESLKEGDSTLDALGWEIYFWEEWKRMDEGVIDFDRARIDAYLERDTEGGGRLAFLRRTRDAAGGLAGRVVLNVGAGRDLLLERFLEEEARVVEVDVVLEPLVRLHRRGADLCVCCDARKLPFEDAAFDVTTSFGTLHHIWPIEEPIAEMIRLTRNHVHVNEPNSYALTRLALRLPSPIRNRLKRWSAGDHSRSPYEGCISPREFVRAVDRAGAEVVSLSYPRSSWIPEGATGLRRAVRTSNMLVLRAFPFASSHFDAVIAARERSDK